MKLPPLATKRLSMNKFVAITLLGLAVSAQAAPDNAKSAVAFDVFANGKLMWTGALANDRKSARFELTAHSTPGQSTPRLLVSTDVDETDCFGLYFGEEQVVGFKQYTAAGNSIAFPQVELRGRCVRGRATDNLNSLAGVALDVGVLQGALTQDSYRVVFHKPESSGDETHPASAAPASAAP